MVCKLVTDVLLPKSRYELTDVVFRQMAAEFSESVELVLRAAARAPQPPLHS